MDLNPRLKSFKCTIRSLVDILETNVFLSKGNTCYFYSTNYSVRSKTCAPPTTENKDSCWEHSKRNRRGSNWQNCWGAKWHYVHLRRCPGYNFWPKGQESRASFFLCKLPKVNSWQRAQCIKHLLAVAKRNTLDGRWALLLKCRAKMQKYNWLQKIIRIFIRNPN